MSLRSIALTTAIGAAAALAACSSSASTTASAPTPAPATSNTAARPSNALPSNVTPTMIALGDSLFKTRNCRNCHGMDAKGTARGPDLTDATLLHVSGTFDDYVRIITDGVSVEAIKDKSRTTAMRPRGGMPPLTDDQVRSIAAYVFTVRK